jgi:hypothetical protein
MVSDPISFIDGVTHGTRHHRRFHFARFNNVSGVFITIKADKGLNRGLRLIVWLSAIAYRLSQLTVRRTMMKAAQKRTIVASAAAVLLFAAMPPAHAVDVMTLVSANRTMCGSLDYRQIQDLKLAAVAQEGVTAFMRYDHFKRPFQQWTTEEAIMRAQAAALTACGVAIGLKPIEQTELATLYTANTR